MPSGQHLNVAFYFLRFFVGLKFHFSFGKAFILFKTLFCCPALDSKVFLKIMADKKVNIDDTPPADGVAPPTEDEKPPPTFEQMWFNDPVEGREAQMLALKLRDGVVLRAETNRIYLERTGIVTFLLQGLKHLAKAK
ncbi:uncharacterized protein [Physcomitrium patens]|nr:uncharacterized protein LOC112285233 isoform X3 [Physcomitrium patens]|eukprot:XP_024381694.1 uncharacterized protein LOC112285233 isoform X3 [Physcomitrella patens]